MEFCETKSPLTREHDPTKNRIAGTGLLFLLGGLYSFGVFNEAVEETATIPGTLDDAVSSSMIYMSLISMPVMMCVGLVLSGVEEVLPSSSATLPYSKTTRIRITSLVGSLFFGCLALGAAGVSTGSRMLIVAAVSLQGVPFGVCT